MRNQETKGDAMNDEELRSTDEAEENTVVAADLDADDPQASGILGAIGRDEVQESVQEEKAAPVMRTSQGASPFLLESLYFS